VKLALPPVNSVKVSQLTVSVTALKGKVGKPTVVAANAKELGSPQGNTQVVTVVSPKSSASRRATFKIWVFIHRFTPVARSATAAEVNAVDIIVKDPGQEGRLRFTNVVDVQTCSQLAHEKGPGKKPRKYNFLRDGWRDAALDNLVPDFDTDVEEQIDTAVFSKPCKGAENPAHDPPPV